VLEVENSNLNEVQKEEAINALSIERKHLLEDKK
jgi:hypothetical protein